MSAVDDIENKAKGTGIMHIEDAEKIDSRIEVSASEQTYIRRKASIHVACSLDLPY